MPDAALVRHDIAIGNLIYGHAQFITLRLAETWDIAPGIGHPEVIAAHDRSDRKWVASGKAWYVLYHRELGWAMELLLQARAPRKGWQPQGDERLTVHGHPAQVRRWQRQRGLFRPKTITFVEVTHQCERSDRLLRLQLSGRCPPEGFEEMLAMIPEWWCH